MPRKSKYSGSEQEYNFVPPLNASQEKFINLIQDNYITVAIANAGSGKTLLALQEGIKMLKNNEIDKVYYVRNPVDFRKFGSQGIGYLKGDKDDKMLPLLKPLLDNLELIVPHGGKRQCMLRKGAIEAIPIDYIQGRSLRDCFVIVDEAQNCSPEIIRMVTTRISDRCKMVIIGGCQKATDKKHLDGLHDAFRRLRPIEGIGAMIFDVNDDIPRHPLVKHINKAYNRV